MIDDAARSVVEFHFQVRVLHLGNLQHVDHVSQSWELHLLRLPNPRLVRMPGVCVEVRSIARLAAEFPDAGDLLGRRKCLIDRGRANGLASDCTERDDSQPTQARDAPRHQSMNIVAGCSSRSLSAWIIEAAS